MEKEIWKDIEGFEGYYQVSSLGRVMGLGRNIKHPSNGGYFVNGKLIKPHKLPNGYIRYNLYKDGEYKRLLMHRLVAFAYISNPKNKPCVNHLDGNPLNNKVSNLEWCTYSENEIHSYEVLGKQSPQKGKIYGNSSNHREILKFSLNNKYICEYSCAKEASDKLGIDCSAITKVCRGKRNKAGGFKWEYKK